MNKMGKEKKYNKNTKAKKTFYLVDTENEGSHKIVDIIREATKDTKIIFFYTKNSEKIYFAMLPEILRSKAKIDVVACDTGKNALDFQLVAYAGALCIKHPNAKYIVVSMDKGYDSALSIYKKCGIDISRMEYSNKQTVIESEKEQPKHNQIGDMMEILLRHEADQANRTSLMYPLGKCKGEIQSSTHTNQEKQPVKQPVPVQKEDVDVTKARQFIAKKG